MSFGSDNVQTSGPLVEYLQPGTTIADGERGSAFRIGDGAWITAGHIVYEFNQDYANPAIINMGNSSILADPYDYGMTYLAFTYDVPTSRTYTDSQGNIQKYTNAAIEGHLGGLALSGSDAVVVTGSGSVDDSDAGLVTFLDPNDVSSAGVSIGSNLTKYWNYDGGTGSHSGSAHVTIDGLTGNGAGFRMLTGADQGQSGGGYTLDYGDKHFLLGVQSSAYADGSASFGVYFNDGFFVQTNERLAEGQHGDVTHSEPTNLIVGSNNADGEIDGSFRADIILGRGGDDLINDGDTPTSTVWANDTLIGGAGNDTLIGGKGDDTFWGGDENDETTPASVHDLVDYSQGSRPITVTYDGTGGTPTLSVADGMGGTDHLHAIEEIKATAARDTFKVVGDIQGYVHLKWDADGGQGASPTDTINTGQASSAVHVSIDDNNGTGSITSTGTGGTIQLAGFHTGIVGSAFNDQITDLSSGTKHISGGGGDDIISIDNGAGVIDGEDGNDSITGGTGNDLLDGGTGANTLIGGAGSDKLVAHGDGDQLDGGAGSDYLQALGQGATLNGGAGDDVIDVNDAYDWTIKPGSGGGHDLVLGSIFDSSGGMNGEGVDISSVPLSEISLVYSVSSEVDEIDAAHGHPIDTPGSVEIYGDLTIIFGDSSITFQDIYATANFGKDLNERHYTGNTDDLFNINPILPAILYDGGMISWAPSENPWKDLGVSISFGNTNTDALGEYTSATSDSGQETPTEGNDNLAGGAGDDAINGGGGDDSASLSGGNDTFDGGAGNDEIITTGAADQFGVSASGHAIVLNDLVGSEGSIAMTSVESIYFQNDDQTLSVTTGGLADDVLSADSKSILFGDDGNDTITGSDFGDTILGGTGNDHLAGMGGSDRYIWKMGDGNDTIVEAAEGGSTNSLDLSDLTNGKTTVTADGNDLLIISKVSGETIRVSGQLEAGGTGGLDEIDFANGTHWSRQDILDHVTPLHIEGTGLNDDLEGSAQEDIVHGGLGDDHFQASGGDDVYLWNIGDGNDVLQGRVSIAGGSDTIRLGEGITPEDLSIIHDPHTANQIVLGLPGGASLAIDGFIGGQSHDLLLQFADGTIWDSAALSAKADATLIPLVGTASADMLEGSYFGDEIRGLGGDDTLGGGEGSDTYVYASGDGNDYIGDTGYSGDTDTLLLSDLNPSQIAFSHGGGTYGGADLIVTDLTTNQQITIGGQFGDDQFGIEQVKFVDGTTLNHSQLEAAASIVQGTSGDDNITLWWDGFLIERSTGNDVINLQDSGDGTIVFGAGDGNHFLTSSPYVDREDVLALDELNPDDVLLTRDVGENPDQMVITVKATGDTFTATRQFNEDHDGGLNQIAFQDGTIWSRGDIASQVLNAAVHGSTSSDSLTGDEGKDQIYGDGGNDTLSGGGGDDSLIGGIGSDQLFGGDGDDYLYGGVGMDTLTGGLGADTFVFAQANFKDSTITDFNTNEDTILLTNSIYIASSSLNDVNGDGVGDLTLNLSTGAHVVVLGVQLQSSIHFEYSSGSPITDSLF